MNNVADAYNATEINALDGNSFHQCNIDLLFSYFFSLGFFSESRDTVEQLFLSKG